MKTFPTVCGMVCYVYVTCKIGEVFKFRDDLRKYTILPLYSISHCLHFMYFIITREENLWGILNPSHKLAQTLFIEIAFVRNVYVCI